MSHSDLEQLRWSGKPHNLGIINDHYTVVGLTSTQLPGVVVETNGFTRDDPSSESVLLFHLTPETVGRVVKSRIEVKSTAV